MRSSKLILIATALLGILSVANMHYGSIATAYEPVIKIPSANLTKEIPLITSNPYDEKPINDNCQNGMIEIIGEYCQHVQEKCLKWIDAKNKYPYMCESFEYPTKCISKTTHMNFCIDKYEAQNNKGEVPEVFVDWFTAKIKCESSGKRLCDTRELTLACEGPELKPYPYGYVRDIKKCNIGNMWIDPDKIQFEKLDRRTPSGIYETCKSDFGVYDGVGNVDEWSINADGFMNKAPYKSALFGGHYVNGIRNRCRDQGVPSITTSHGPGAKNYEISYRCCSDPLLMSKD